MNRRDSKSKLAAVALFHGDDAIGKTHAVEDYLSAIRAQHSDAEELRFDPSTESVEDFTGKMLSPSLFSTVRIFRLRHANLLSKQERAAVAEITGYEIPDTFLIIEVDESGTKKKESSNVVDELGLKAAVKKNPAQCRIVECIKPPDYKLAEWLTEKTPELFNRTIQRQDADFLVESVGKEIGALYAALQKIDIALDDGKPVTRKAVEAVVGTNRTMSIFELASALGQRNAARAFEIIDSLFGDDFSAPMAAAVLFRHFFGLMRIRLLNRENPDLIRRYTGAGGDRMSRMLAAKDIGVGAGYMRPGDSEKRAYPIIILSGVVEQARSFKEQHLKKVFSWLSEYDVGTKTGRVSDDIQTFKLLCHRILRVSGQPV
jgi:DNA polymerase III delta subunit